MGNCWRLRAQQIEPNISTQPSISLTRLYEVEDEAIEPLVHYGASASPTGMRITADWSNSYADLDSDSSSFEDLDYQQVVSPFEARRDLSPMRLYMPIPATPKCM